MGIDEPTQTPYLVMEFMEGQPLDKILAKGSVPLPRACAWTGEIASALNLAHRRGVIHGDIKPANILILDDGRVKLTDFGMARLASHDKKDTPLLGTPAYWCPEQILGRPQDARSDIFSLGVVLYELVTGKRPFDSDSSAGNLHAGSFFETASGFSGKSFGSDGIRRDRCAVSGKRTCSPLSVRGPPGCRTCIRWLAAKSPASSANTAH